MATQRQLEIVKLARDIAELALDFSRRDDGVPVALALTTIMHGLSVALNTLADIQERLEQ